MAKLKDIKGSAIQYLAEDPVEYVGTWSSGGNLNQARTYSGASGIGTQTDSLLFGGRKNSAPATNTKINSYFFISSYSHNVFRVYRLVMDYV